MHALVSSFNKPGEQVAGRYTLLEVLGQGGTSVVWAAYDARLDRRVALKLLHSHLRTQDEDEALMQTRLVREAQAMARLSHPHVVAVYDAGKLEDGAIYLAMEYVEGQTLGAWCREHKRTWREVLAAYLAAARGLAAAHGVGLVHRDFKPDNVLVGMDGRVRVTDFGLAQGQSQTPSRLTPLAPTEEEWNRPLTQDGAIMGTLRYMAPERLKGQPADERSDLYAFCVSLYEGLYGHPPFPGDTVTARLQAQQTRMEPTDTRSEVPVWLGRTVLRGLSPAPHLRPATMLQLITALEQDPSERWRRRTRALIFTGLGMALMGLSVGGWWLLRAPRCEGLEQQLTNVWDEPIRARVRQALRSGAHPYALPVERQLERKLDEYASQWVTLRRQVCMEEHQTESRTVNLTARKLTCLERRRNLLQSLTEVLTLPGDGDMTAGVVQVASLPPLDDCMDEQGLLAALPLPEDLSVLQQVRELQPEVDRLEVLFETGQYTLGMTRGEALLRRVSSLEYPPLQAQALYRMGWLQWGTGNFVAAEALARQAIMLATRAQDRVLQARAWALLVRLLRESGHAADALTVRLALDAAVEAAGDGSVQAASLNELGNVLRVVGDYKQALQVHQRAVTLFEQSLGPAHPRTVGALNDLATIDWQIGRSKDALALFERVEAGWTETLGPEHPYVAGALTNKGSVLLLEGRVPEALQACERALELFERALGPQHPNVAIALNNLAPVLSAVGRTADARASLERALAIFEQMPKPDASARGIVLGELGALSLKQGDTAQAVALLERALKLTEQSPSAFVQFTLAQALMASGGDPIRARQLATAALEFWRKLDHTQRIQEVTRWLDAHPPRAHASNPSQPHEVGRVWE